MLKLDYLQSILFVDDKPDIEGIDNVEKIIESRAGMNGAIQLLQSKGLSVAIVLEHAERHGFSLHNMGGFHECTQSIWVMEMVAADELPEDVMDRCLARCQRLYTIFVNHIEDRPLAGWIENNEVNAYARDSGSYVGYEMFINFRENMDLSYVPRS